MGDDSEEGMGEVVLSLDLGQDNLSMQPTFPYPCPSSDHQFFGVSSTYFFPRCA